MEFMLRSETRAVADTYPEILGSEVEARLHYLLNALDSMDKRTALDLEQVSRSTSDEDLKDFVRQNILAHHAAKRLPLVEAVECLRGQYRAIVVDDMK